MFFIKSFKNQIYLGIFVALIVSLMVFLVALAQVNSTRFLSERLESLRRPTTEASQRLEMSIYMSLASLRGWLLLKDKDFLLERERAWKQVDALLVEMDGLSQHWTNPENNKRLAEFRPLIEDFRRYQVDVVRTSESDLDLANHILGNRAAPAAQRILDILETMVEDQKHLHQTDIVTIKDELDFLLRFLALAIIVVFILALCYAYWIVDSVVTPLSKALGCADRISKLNLDASICLSGPDEIIRLGHSLESMRQHLKVNQETLHERNEELLQFSYRTSHDLKGPLSTTRQLADFILKDLKNNDLEEVEQNACRIVKQMTQLERLVLDLLALAKSDLMSQEIGPVDFGQLAAEVEKQYEESIRKNGIDFSTSIDVTRKHYSQHACLLQIMSNLVSNGAKYCDKCKQIRFVKLSVCDDAHYVYIQVSDNGQGIPAKDKSEIYKMFRKFHKDNRLGSGLGMYIVKKSVDRLKGKIDYETSEAGTTFDVVIPTENAAISTGKL